MLFYKFVIFLICIILLSISTSALVEFFMCQRPEFNPKLWNHDFVKKYNNCYIYALNKPKTTRVKKTSPGLGEIGGGEKGIGDFGRDYSNYTCKYFDKLIKHDIPGIKKSNANSVQELQCPPDHYEIALVLDDGGTPKKMGDNDFHFYRKDCNTEFWSHKPGAAAVTKKDASGNFILDPKFSDRNFPNHNYYKFCSYYCVPNKTDIYEATKKELKMK